MRKFNYSPSLYFDQLTGVHLDLGWINDRNKEDLSIPDQDVHHLADTSQLCGLKIIEKAKKASLKGKCIHSL